MKNIEKLLQLLADGEKISRAQDLLDAIVDDVMERYAPPQELPLVPDDEMDDDALEQLSAAGSKNLLQARKR